MGWTCTDKSKSITVAEFFQNRFGDHLEILDHSVVNFRECYMAVKVKETEEVFAAVILLDFKGDGHYNFCYKDMDETVGPAVRNCPERILNKLTPTNNEYAIKWREECWKNINEREKKPKPKNGDIIQFASPITFSNGDKLDTFKVFQKGNRFRFGTTTSYSPAYQISGWRKREFKIIA